MLLDIFKNDAFSVASLSAALNRLPYVPSRIGRMGLFQSRPITTTTAMIEQRFGKLHLLQTKQRGSGQTQTQSRAERKMIAVSVPHIPQEDAVLADEVQGIRAFGSETELELFSNVVNEKLQAMRQNHEATNEYHRMGAIRGEILDADATVILNLFDLFGVTEQSFAFPMDATDGALKMKCVEVQRYMRDAMAADAFTGIHAFAGDEFFDALVSAPEVRDSYLRWQSGEFFRTTQGVNETGFTWGGITWENYRGKVGAVDFVEADQARIFPTGAPGLFQVFYAPADYIETVNTPGRPFYAKRERMKFDKGEELQTQTNPLHVCTRPSTLVLGTIE